MKTESCNDPCSQTGVGGPIGTTRVPPPETVSARMVALHPPAGTCGEWTLNLEVAGLNTSAIGLGGGNPFSLVLEDEQGEGANCFNITNAIVGNQIIVPGHSTRRGVRRQTRR